MTLVTEADQRRIAEAITKAERATSGEIVAVIAPQSSNYLHGPFLWAALVALAVPWPFVFWTWWPIQHIYLLQLATFAGARRRPHAACRYGWRWCRDRSSMPGPTAAPWSSSWRRTCTPPSAARAC